MERSRARFQMVKYTEGLRSKDAEKLVKRFRERALGQIRKFNQEDVLWEA